MFRVLVQKPSRLGPGSRAGSAVFALSKLVGVLRLLGGILASCLGVKTAKPWDASLRFWVPFIVPLTSHLATVVRKVVPIVRRAPAVVHFLATVVENVVVVARRALAVVLFFATVVPKVVALARRAPAVVHFLATVDENVVELARRALAVVLFFATVDENVVELARRALAVVHELDCLSSCDQESS